MLDTLFFAVSCECHFYFLLWSATPMFGLFVIVRFVAFIVVMPGRVDSFKMACHIRTYMTSILNCMILFLFSDFFQFPCFTLA